VTPARFPPARFENIEKRYGGLYALCRFRLVAPRRMRGVRAQRLGKTTLLRVARTLGAAVQRYAEFSGESDDGEANSVRSGFVAHATMVYDELTAEETFCHCTAPGTAQPEDRVEALLQEVGGPIAGFAGTHVLSGMRQRVALPALRRPSVLLLDEPATG
jgi:ABC-type multidrug transport system ATPase subunit